MMRLNPSLSQRIGDSQTQATSTSQALSPNMNKPPLYTLKSGSKQNSASPIQTSNLSSINNRSTLSQSNAIIPESFLASGVDSRIQNYDSRGRILPSRYEELKNEKTNFRQDAHDFQNLNRSIKLPSLSRNHILQVTQSLPQSVSQSSKYSDYSPIPILKSGAIRHEKKLSRSLNQSLRNQMDSDSNVRNSMPNMKPSSLSSKDRFMILSQSVASIKQKESYSVQKPQTLKPSSSQNIFRDPQPEAISQFSLNYPQSKKVIVSKKDKQMKKTLILMLRADAAKKIVSQSKERAIQEMNNNIWILDEFAPESNKNNAIEEYKTLEELDLLYAQMEKMDKRMSNIYEDQQAEEYSSSSCSDMADTDRDTSRSPKKDKDDGGFSSENFSQAPFNKQSTYFSEFKSTNQSMRSIPRISLKSINIDQQLKKSSLKSGNNQEIPDNLTSYTLPSIGHQMSSNSELMIPDKPKKKSRNTINNPYHSLPMDFSNIDKPPGFKSLDRSSTINFDLRKNVNLEQKAVMPKHKSTVLQPGSLNFLKNYITPLAPVITEEDERKESDTARKHRSIQQKIKLIQTQKESITKPTSPKTKQIGANSTLEEEGCQDEPSVQKKSFTIKKLIVQGILNNKIDKTVDKKDQIKNSPTSKQIKKQSTSYKMIQDRINNWRLKSEEQQLEDIQQEEKESGSNSNYSRSKTNNKLLSSSTPQSNKNFMKSLQPKDFTSSLEMIKTPYDNSRRPSCIGKRRNTVITPDEAQININEYLPYLQKDSLKSQQNSASGLSYQQFLDKLSSLDLSKKHNQL